MIKTIIQILTNNRENILKNFDSEFRLKTALIFSISEFAVMTAVSFVLAFYKGPKVASGTGMLAILAFISIILCVRLKPLTAVHLLLLPTFLISLSVSYFVLKAEHFNLIFFSSSIMLLSLIIPAGIIINRIMALIFSAIAITHIITISFMAHLHKSYYYTTMPLIIQAFVAAGIFVYYSSLLQKKMASVITKYNNELEELVEERSKELIEAEKLASLGTMVAGAAHEINTPLGVSITAASHLQHIIKNTDSEFKTNRLKKTDLEMFFGKSNESSDIILNNLHRAGEFVQNFKKLAVDQISEEMRLFNLKEYIDGIILNLHPILKQTSITIQVDCHNDIELNSYPGIFAQILTNLITNSIYHAFDENDSGNINISINENSSHLIIIYTDNGKGISPENIKRIYDPFFTTNRSKGGSGLGMNITYNLITRKLDGKITCKSQIGEGVTFTIDLPSSIISKN